MRSKKASWNLVGTIIIEVILFVDLAVDLYSGKMNGSDLIRILSICLLLTIPFVIIVRKIRKRRISCSPEKNRSEN